MAKFVYIYVLVVLFFNTNDATRSDNPLQGTNSICADVCTSSEAHVELDLSVAQIYRQHENVQIKFDQTTGGRCREPALLQIPLDTIGKHGIIKFDLSFGPVLHNFSIDIGLNDEDNKTIRTINIFNQQVSVEYHSHNNENEINLNEQSVTLLGPGDTLSIFVSNEWIHIMNKERNQSKLTINLKKANPFLFNEYSSATELLIGLNRNVNGTQTGIGLCLANITFIECYTDEKPALYVDTDNKRYEQNDVENITWISHLNYLDPNSEIRECTSQGVVRLTFDPDGSRRIARFDLNMGSQVHGFTFNIGDSPTNNGYGGDGGTTSNSAEIHSNDNRFYIWANTKICDDTLLLNIDYNVIEPYDNITILVSNERIELTNHRSYHRILHSPYLYALARQNVTCNCFDSLCYPGVQPDNDVYFGINRVIGGTYRPGIGVCNAHVNWIQCKKIEVSPRIKYEPVVTTRMTSTMSSTSEATITTSITTSTSTTTITTTTLPEETTISTSTKHIDITTKSLEHANETIMNTELPSSTTKTEESNQTNQDYSSSTFVSIPLTTIYNEERPTTAKELEMNRTESTIDDMTTNQVGNEEQSSFTTVSTNVDNEEVLPVLKLSNDYRLFNLLTNLSQYVTQENSINEKFSDISNSTSIENNFTTIKPADPQTSSNPCTYENLAADFVYHEYPLDKHKFIFCDSEGKMNIIACPPNHIWSQMEQSCILPG